HLDFLVRLRPLLDCFCRARRPKCRRGHAHLLHRTLTAPMPNLDNLRKQAKQFLRWHRDRYYPVAAEIRAALPRFRSLSDRQILDAPFRLGDAQEIVARRLGYETWPALKAGVKVMSISEASATPVGGKPELSKPVLSA